MSYRPPFTVRIFTKSAASGDGGAAPSEASATAQSKTSRAAKRIAMNFELLDRYLLEEKPPKAALIKELLKKRYDIPGAAAFYQGMEMLGVKTPDLSLIALRLLLAGKKADDSNVVRIRTLIERARAKGVDAQASIDAYHREFE